MINTNENKKTPPDLALEIKDLRKNYKKKDGGELCALDGVSLNIPRGSVYALLGPNGAGKSTLINILAGLVIKSSGDVKIWDIDIDKEPRNSRAAIGIVPQELNIDPFFVPEDLLELQAGLYGIAKPLRRTQEILELIGLKDKARAYARSLSGGMRRRLLVGKAMVHNPPILVLDEPTAGVDVELRRQLWDNVMELNAKGVTILLTTHYLEEAQELCDHIAIINHGKLIVNEPKKTLFKRIDAKSLIFKIHQEIPIDSPMFAQFQTTQTTDEDGIKLSVQYLPSSQKVNDILTILASHQVVIQDISTSEVSLEDIFIQLTKTKGAVMKNKLQRIMLVFAILLFTIQPSNSQAFGRQKAPESFADIVEPLTPMVVNIRTTQEVSGRDLAELYGFPPGFPMEEFLEKFGNGLKKPDNKDKDKKQKATSLGSGFIIQSDGVIVTNNHVIQGATEIIVVLADEREFPAEVIGSDDRTDLALLKIKAQNLPFAQFGDSNKMRVGDWVIAIGNPLGLGGTVTAGIVSARGRDIQNGPYDDFLQTDASINRGNSGGPLFNVDGKVIGINTAIFSQSGGSIGIGFAIPAAQAKDVIEQIKKFGTTKRGWLGVAIQEVNDEIAQSLGLNGAPRGALVSGVQKKQPR